jgi:ATP-binding cassette subfamily B protein
MPFSRIASATATAWDGVDLADMDAAQVHRRIALIFQDFAHYDLTARENIGLGAIEHIDDPPAIRTAAAHAGADGYLQALPAGYETILSPEHDGGRDLSVGQWQRAALARAFIREAPLIILDEPTAALDPRAEHDLYTRIRTLYKGHTGPAHLTPLQHRVRRRPHLRARPRPDHRTRHHDQLMNAAGVYAELFTLQATALHQPALGQRPQTGHERTTAGTSIGRAGR